MERIEKTMKFKQDFLSKGIIEMNGFPIFDFKMIVSVVGVHLIYTKYRKDGLCDVLNYNDETVIFTEDEINDAVTKAMNVMLSECCRNEIVSVTSQEGIEIQECDVNEMTETPCKYKCSKQVAMIYKYCDSCSTDFINIQIDTWGFDKHELIDIVDTII